MIESDIFHKLQETKLATITLKSWQVIDACNAKITQIKAARIKHDEETIARVMATGRREFPLFYKIHFPTEEQAISLLNREAGFFDWRSQYDWRDLEHAEKLLNLAKRGDPVTLNEEDCRVIF